MCACIWFLHFQLCVSQTLLWDGLCITFHVLPDMYMECLVNSSADCSKLSWTLWNSLIPFSITFAALPRADWGTTLPLTSSISPGLLQLLNFNGLCCGYVISWFIHLLYCESHININRTYYTLYDTLDSILYYISYVKNNKQNRTYCGLASHYMVAVVICMLLDYQFLYWCWLASSCYVHMYICT